MKPSTFSKAKPPSLSKISRSKPPLDRLCQFHGAQNTRFKSILKRYNCSTPTAGFEYAIVATTVPAEARILPPASLPFPDLERANQSLEQVIQKYPAAKTIYIEGFTN